MGSKRFEDKFTVYVISNGSMEIFNQNIIEYQHVGDAKAPLLCVIHSL